MLLKTIALLALAATSLAAVHPKRHPHFHYHHKPSGMLMPSGGQFPSNGADGMALPTMGSTAPISTVPLVTMTVIPLPASSNLRASAPAYVSSGSPVAAVQSPAPMSSAGADSWDEEGEDCTYNEGTSTIRSTEFVTVTISPAVAAGETGAPAGTTATSTSSSPAASTSVSAGAFFQKPSTATSSPTSAYGVPGAGSILSASVPTTFAISTAAGTSAGSSIVSAAALSSTSTTSPGGSTGGQRGLAYSIASLTNAFAGDGMTWAYNWASAPGGAILSGLEYVPMLWGLKDLSTWNSAAMSAIASGSRHILSFNEPDLPTQANMSPSVAASTHIQYMNPFEGQALIGSPAITNGAGTNPLLGIDWLNSFFQSCGGKCKVDFVAFHWYDSATNFAYFQTHVTDVINAAAANGISKVWLTEFGASGTDAQVESFLAQALPFLDSTPAVERYAYYMCGTASSQLISGTSLSAIGQAYAA